MYISLNIRRNRVLQVFIGQLENENHMQDLQIYFKLLALGDY